MKKNLFILFVVATIRKRRTFTSAQIDPYELWSLPFHIVMGLKNERTTANSYEVAEMYCRYEEKTLLAEAAIQRFAKYVNPNNPDHVIATLNAGISSDCDEMEELREFFDDMDNASLIEEFGVDLYEVSTALYLGKVATGYPKTLKAVLALLPYAPTQHETIVRKLDFLEKFLKQLAKVSGYKSQELASMLVAGGYTL